MQQHTTVAGAKAQAPFVEGLTRWGLTTLPRSSSWSKWVAPWHSGKETKRNGRRGERDRKDGEGEEMLTLM